MKDTLGLIFAYQREELMKSKQLFCCEIPCSGGEERIMEAQTDI